ncbi:ankyrin repeat domain-containing protein SOWAHB [Myotis myotis]|uniref:Sosondowah ankyrin repeat domain family member B n=1 Tax=Myotis myotis TaxID=51298 RepID=A0A7J8ARG5_MYOMY|nr:ankyrin repeat domain-containing protein SOWAHB [Myotis myotis]KAF6389004.1 sosondowah ankyrin repeat domain family member B [Myotis myotis]
MARELSQEALLDFLCQAGGRVTNAALLSHFKSFLRDPGASPGQHQRRRELFKGFVNSVAAVRQDPDGTKYVVLKKRYRDLLGEEGLQRPRDPPAAAAPAGGAAPCSPPAARPGEAPRQPRRRRRGKEQEEEPAGAAAPAADPGCNGLSASGAREAARGGGGRRRGSDPRAPVSAAAAAAAQVGAKCAAAETQGRCCWECLQNGLGGLPGEPLAGALPDPATAREEPARAPAAPDDRRAPGQEQGGAPAEPAPVPAAPLSPPPTVEATGSGASPPAVLSSCPPPGDRPELMTPGDLHHSRQQLQQQQQQQRTREWVARHPHAPEARDQGPTRVWSVLPENFPLELGFGVPEPNSAPLDPPVSPHSLSPAVPEAWPGNPPLAVFRSIRSQLSLQELDDFVDQNSHSSEESSSGPKESPGGSEEGLRIALGTPDWRKLRNSAGGLSPKEGDCSRSPQCLRNRGDGHAPQQVPPGANGLAGQPQEPLPSPAPRLRRSLRMSSWAGRAALSSSDEECPEEDLLKRSRRPPRSRKPSKAGAASSPRVDAALTPNPADVKAAVAARSRLHSVCAPGRQAPAALVPHRPEHKPSLVPLDAREHEWMVKLATGSWIRVLTLFWEDPQLALHKDFLTGYTALHWIAKHGDLRALQDFVGSAQKARVALDVNAKSSGGYTPLHLAAIHGHQGVMKLLVERLASRVNIRDSSGKKPWQYLTRNTSGEIWQLLGGPRGKPIFPVYPLVRSSSPTRKAKSREISRHITRKTSLAALLKSQHHKWKSANQYEKFPTPKEREEYSD